MRKILFLMLVFTFLISAAALATPDRAQNVAGKFAQMDKNGDGSVSWEEFSAFYPQMHKAAFESIDASKDSLISLEEWQEFSSGHSRDRAASGMGAAASDGKGGMVMPPPGMGAKTDSPEDQKVRELFNIVPRNESK